MRLPIKENGWPRLVLERKKDQCTFKEYENRGRFFSMYIVNVFRTVPCYKSACVPALPKIHFPRNILYKAKSLTFSERFAGFTTALVNLIFRRHEGEISDKNIIYEQKCLIEIINSCSQVFLDFVQVLSTNNLDIGMLSCSQNNELAGGALSI